MSDDVQFVDDNDDRSGVTGAPELLMPGTELFKEGLQEDRCFSLNSGRVSLHRGEKKVCELFVDDTNPRDLFLGAAAILLSDPEHLVPQPFTVIGVQEPVSFYSPYSGEDLRKIFTTNEKLAERLFESLGRQLGVLEEAIDPSLAGRTQTQFGALISDLSDPVRKIHRMRSAIREMAEEIVRLGQRA